MLVSRQLTVKLLIFCLITGGFSYSTAQNTHESTQQALSIIGLEYTQAETDSMQENLASHLKDYEQLRTVALNNSVMPSILFNPLPAGFTPAKDHAGIDWEIPESFRRPEHDYEIAFLSIPELAALLRSRQITSSELTKIYLERLHAFADTLRCVVTITEDLAMEQAEQADREIAEGNYRGLLHGIPYGVKDLLAVEGYPTTWGAMPYKDQEIPQTATIVQKLQDAGAVLVAKLTMGALAWGDVWFGGKTRNPWNLRQGSSGSSAGSASATAAGLVGFSIGTETWGSIVSPSTRCGNSGLRPTYGRVSRAGAMALSWSMDKIGPICRNAEDCAIVFDAIRGPDVSDPTLIDAAFDYQPARNVRQLKVGFASNLFEEDYPNKENDEKTLETLKNLGINLIPLKLETAYPVEALNIILSAEAAAAFDELTRSNRDSLLVRQIKNAWPNVFRSARLIPAVEYIQANRIRTLIIQEMHRFMQQVDVLVVPSFTGDQLLMTNLTGHPAVVVPNGFDAGGSPTSITFLANLFEEGKALEVARVFQQKTDFEDQIPPLFKKDP